MLKEKRPWCETGSFNGKHGGKLSSLATGKCYMILIAGHVRMVANLLLSVYTPA
jgi:hypothetical protein